MNRRSSFGPRNKINEPRLLDRRLLESFPLPDHPDDSDKSDRGLCVLVAGSRELPGPAILAGLGAMRAGAGKVRIATGESIAITLGAAIPEARVIGFAEGADGCIAPDAIAGLVERLRGANSLTIGPGMQAGAALAILVQAVLNHAGTWPLILDAAALGMLPTISDRIIEWPGGTILLPHAGEMARLLERDRATVTDDPLGAAHEAARAFNSIVVIKGEWSFIVSPDGDAFRFRGGGIGLATSGSGDTLAGIVGGLTARGADCLTAALSGVYLHGEAGRRLGGEVGTIGFLAREIPDQVPRLMDEIRIRARPSHPSRTGNG